MISTMDLYWSLHIFIDLIYVYDTIERSQLWNSLAEENISRSLKFAYSSFEMHTFSARLKKLELELKFNEKKTK